MKKIPKANEIHYEIDEKKFMDMVAREEAIADFLVPIMEKIIDVFKRADRGHDLDEYIIEGDLLTESLREIRTRRGE